MKKKLFAIASICAAIIIPDGLVSAESTNEGYNVKINLKIEPNEKAIVYVVPKGEAITDDDSIIAIKQEQADKNGDIVFAFDIRKNDGSNSWDGEYDAFIKRTGNETIEESIVFSSDENKANLNEKIRALTNEAELKSLIEDSANYVPLKAEKCNIDEFLTFSSENRDRTVRIINDKINNYSIITNKDFSEIFNKAIAVVQIKDNQNFDKSIKDGGFEFEGTAYADETSTRRDWIAEYISSEKINNPNALSSIDAFQKTYNDANILFLINKARFSEFETLIKKYQNELGEDIYKLYINTKSKNKLNDKLVERLKNKPAKTISELYSAIKSITDSLGDTGSGTGTGATGSSASSGDTGGIISAIPVAQNIDNISKDLFNDLYSAKWAETAIREAVKRNIVSGDGQGNFRPNDPIKREEFVKMLVTALGVYDANSDCSFSDVSSGDWSYKYIASAFENGIIFGSNENKFGIGEKLTRQDMAVLMYRVLDKNNSLEAEGEPEFEDSAEISDYAKEAVTVLSKKGIINGMGNGLFEPLGTATRAQSVQLIYNVLIK